MRTRKRVQRALRALPASGRARDADYQQNVFAAIRFLAQACNGQCLSSAFEGHMMPLAFECAAGHRIELKIHGVHIGNWCSRCVYDRRSYSIADAQRIAGAKGGMCLSTLCEGAKERLRWQCAHHHEWVATLDGVLGETGVVSATLRASNLRMRSWTASHPSAVEGVFLPISTSRRRCDGSALDGIRGQPNGFGCAKANGVINARSRRAHARSSRCAYWLKSAAGVAYLWHTSARTRSSSGM
jgi:hypothetical protein